MANDEIIVKRGGGYIGAFGSRIDEIARRFNQETTIVNPTTSPYHVTLLTKDELRDCSGESLLNLEQVSEDACKIDTKHIYPIGLGGDPRSVCWIVVIWNAGNIFRKKLGLSSKQFHITLTGNDEHTVDKGLNSLREPISSDRLDINVLDHIVLSFQLNEQYDQAYVYAREMCQYHGQSEKGWLRLADLARRNEQHKLAMLAYVLTMQLANGTGVAAAAGPDKVQEYCAKKVVQIALNHTEWGCVFWENELDQVPSELRASLMVPWPTDLIRTLVRRCADDQPQWAQIPREHLFVPLINRRSSNQEPGK